MQSWRHVDHDGPRIDCKPVYILKPDPIISKSITMCWLIYKHLAVLTEHKNDRKSTRKSDRKSEGRVQRSTKILLTASLSRVHFLIRILRTYSRSRYKHVCKTSASLLRGFTKTINCIRKEPYLNVVFSKRVYETTELDRSGILRRKMSKHSFFKPEIHCLLF